jgi:MFS family permease
MNIRQQRREKGEGEAHGRYQHRADPTLEAARTSERGIPILFRALGYRNYRLFFGGQLISLIGTWMQMVAQSWLIYRLTGSAVLLGFVGFAGQVPVFLLAPFTGALIDRANRHRIITGTQTASMLLAFVLAGLTLRGVVHVWHIFVLAAMMGIVNALDIPARQVFVVEMVGREDMVNAIALNSSMFNGARIVGPAIAGALVSAIGEGWCFFANGISYVAVIVGLLMMKVPSKAKVDKPSSTLAHIREGFQFVYRTRPIRALLVMLGVISIVAMPYSVLMPIFADSILHGGPSALGLLMGASGAGALAGAITLASRRDVRGLGRWVAVASVGFGVSLVAFSMAHLLWLSALLLVPVGFAMMVQMAASNTLVQTMSPDNLRGRVMSVYSMMFMGMAPIGSLLAGALAGRLGAPMTVAAGGIICVIAAAVFASRLPILGVEARRLMITQEAAAGDPARAMTAGSVLPDPGVD